MKAETILERMTEEEKISFLSGKNNWETMDFPQYGIPSLFLADGPCGLRKQTGKGDHLGIEDSVPATATVSGGCLAATWNPGCAYENGRILGEEAAQEQVDVLLAPALNIVRSPLCGRNFEYFSEDPCLTGKIATGYVEGVQGAGVGACLKHYAVNNQETEREYINAVIDERTMREIYLPAFEEAVTKANPQAVMSALNQINGTYGAEHKELLTDILRKEWGFEGFTVSDWYGIVHPEKAIAAGMDLDMPYSGGVGAERIRKALEEKRLTWEEVDACCLRLLKAVERCMERSKLRKQKEKKSLLECHHEKAVKIAEEGIVLLKNEEKILPLSEKEQIGVIGLYAKEPRITLEGSARVVNMRREIPLECMERIGGDKVKWSQGYGDGKGEEADALMEDAIALAKECEKVVFFMGQPSGVEMEGHDRKNLNLPEDQENLLQKILEVNSNVVVVLSNASPVIMPWKEQVKGIFECFMAGQGMGLAIARLLYGKVNPSGKLPVSFTKRLEDTSAYFYFPGDKEKVEYGEGVFVGYRYYDIKHTDLLYPFGYGLSYTTFLYKDLRIEKSVFGQGEEELHVSVTLKNTGDRAGAEVVQLYVRMFDTVMKRPQKELKKFQKIHLEPGEEICVNFTLNKRDFAYYDVRYKEWYVPEGNYGILIGSSSQDILLEEYVKVVPDRKHRKVLSGWSQIGELRKTSAGEEYFKIIKKVLSEHMPEETVFFNKKDLENDNKINQLSLRLVNLLSNGIINNDHILKWVAEVNKER